MGILYRVGDYIFDTDQNTLSKGGTRATVPPKQLQLLFILIQAEGRPVKREKLMREAWPDVFVDKHTLNQTVHLLRQTLGKLPNGQEYIETIPRYGYRLATSVSLHSPEKPLARGFQSSSLPRPLVRLWKRITSRRFPSFY